MRKMPETKRKHSSLDGKMMFLKKDITDTDQLLKVCKMLLVNQTSNKMLENK